MDTTLANKWWFFFPITEFIEGGKRLHCVCLFYVMQLLGDRDVQRYGKILEIGALSDVCAG